MESRAVMRSGTTTFAGMLVAQNLIHQLLLAHGATNAWVKLAEVIPIGNGSDLTDG